MHILQHKVYDHDVEHECTDDVKEMVFGTEGEERCECSCSGDEREDDRHDGAAALWSVGILDDLDACGHLKSHDEDDDGTGYGKRVDIYAEEVENHVAEEEEGKEHDERVACCLSRVDWSALLLNIYRDRSETSDIDHRKDYDESTDDLLDVESVYLEYI